MKYRLLELLVCPSCRRALQLRDERENAGEIESGTLACAGCGAQFPIVAFVPRFVPPENYSSSFVFSGIDSATRNSTASLTVDYTRPILRTVRVGGGRDGGSLDARLGCGAGRFAEIALGAGAQLVAVDYSSAVDACRQNLGPHPRLDVVQADVYRLPFRRQRFDFVNSLGVLQHTPDAHAAFAALVEQLAPGGHIAVDVCPQLALNIVWPKYWLRPFTKLSKGEGLSRDRERALC